MYKIIFQDNTIFKGGEFYDSKWNNIPNKNIARIEYYFNKKILILENYESYNHLVEWTVLPFHGNQKKPTKIMLMARKENEVIIYTYDFIKSKLKVNVKDFSKEYYGKPTRGWKKGIKEGNPKSYLS